MGRHDDVLAELDPGLAHLEAAPAAEVVRVREAALNHGAGAAKALQRWQLALTLNEAIVKSRQARAASPSEIAAQRSLSEPRRLLPAAAQDGFPLQDALQNTKPSGTARKVITDVLNRLRSR